MIVRLGYVSLPLSINITSSKTITYTRFKNINDGFNKIDSIILDNLDALYEILKYNKANNIHFYRMTSALIPLATLNDVKFDYITPYLNLYKKVGDFANKNGIRVDAHPDQFCVLNSINKDIVKNSIEILKYQKNLSNAFGFTNFKLVLHVGSSAGGKKASITRFINNFNKLEDSIKKMIILENDDKVFNIIDVLELSEKLKIPMVLDYHHYICNNNNEDIEKYLPRIFNTWKDEVYPPKVHFSTPKSKRKNEFRSHNDFINADDFITFLEIVKKYTNRLDVMIEAKAKDLALFKLVRELKYKKEYQFIDDTSFIVK